MQNYCHNGSSGVSWDEDNKKKKNSAAVLLLNELENTQGNAKVGVCKFANKSHELAKYP